MKNIITLCLILALAMVCWATVTGNINLSLSLSGLGNSSVSYSKNFTATTPNAYTSQHRVLDSNNVAEAIDLGDVTTEIGVMIACVDDSDSNSTGGINVDCDFSASFDADILILEGEAAYFCPVGTVYVNGANSIETPTYEYVVLGTR